MIACFVWMICNVVNLKWKFPVYTECKYGGPLGRRQTVSEHHQTPHKLVI